LFVAVNFDYFDLYASLTVIFGSLDESVITFFLFDQQGNYGATLAKIPFILLLLFLGLFTGYKLFQNEAKLCSMEILYE
jgi:hypothetical protein